MCVRRPLAGETIFGVVDFGSGRSTYQETQISVDI